MRGLGADAVTANPLLGATRSRRSSRSRARADGAGVFVLVRTSNPGAADVQDLELAGGGRRLGARRRARRELGEAGDSGSPTSAP